MNIGEKLNMTMLCDFYELTMGNGYFENGFKDKITYFDVFFRRVPDKGGFAIAAGLEQLIRYIEDLHFTPEDIAYLRGRNLFCEEFLEYLANFRFTGDIYAVPEGTPVFRGMKAGDVDPRGKREYCDTVSDKALAVGGGVLEAVLALPAKYRTAVHLYYYEELSVAEIAAVLGKSEGAVKSRLFRARALLRRYLKEDDDVSERL